MLRIQKSNERNKLVLSLSGRIEAEDVAELQRLCRFETDDRNLVLDLGDVTLVNRDAIEFLAGCEANGAKVRNCPAYVCEWIAKERGSEKR
jgi:anti-anti-sigma regulatory factor